MDLHSNVALGAIAGLAGLVGLACGGAEMSGFETCSPVAEDNAVIDQDNLAFSPSSLCVRAGHPFVFRNSESALHTVTVKGGKNLSGTMRKGDEFRVAGFSGPASYDITCDFHPQMRARIIVVVD